MNTQKKVTAFLEGVATERKLHLVVDGGAASNAGSFRFASPGELDPVLSVRFDFQGYAATFKWRSPTLNREVTRLAAYDAAENKNGFGMQEVVTLIIDDLDAAMGS